MTTRVNLDLQALREAAESHDARHVHLEHFTYPPGTRIAVNLTLDFDAMLLRRLSNEPTMQRAKGEFGAMMDVELVNDGPVIVMVEK